MARIPTLLMVSLLSAGAAFAQTAPPTQDSILDVLNHVYALSTHGGPATAHQWRHGRRGIARQHAEERRAGSHRPRINTYESGVTYAGLLLATKYTGELRYRAHVNTRLAGLARYGAAHAGRLPDGDLRDVSEIRVRRLYSLRPMIFPQNLDESGAMCAAMIKAQRPGITRLRPWIDNYANWCRRGNSAWPTAHSRATSRCRTRCGSTTFT